MLRSVYAAALARANDPQALRADQRRWLQLRRNSLPEVAVLHTLYQARIRELQAEHW
jgi:uncharacterized protein